MEVPLPGWENHMWFVSTPTAGDGHHVNEYGFTPFAHAMLLGALDVLFSREAVQRGVAWAKVFCVECYRLRPY